MAKKTKNGRQKSTDTHVLDPQEDCLDEMVSFEHPKPMF